MKGTHRESLLVETGLHRLSDRRSIHKLVLLYKMINNDAPNYLLSICPREVGDLVPYSLRNASNLDLPSIRTEKAKLSFLYSTTCLWNSLPHEIRISPSSASFKTALATKFYYVPRVNPLVYLGDRYPAILHTRLRLGHCGLNSCLYSINCSPSPRCRCGAHQENPLHFLLQCPFFAVQRATLLTSVDQSGGYVWRSACINEKLTILLHGSSELSLEENQAIFLAVRNFIVDTKRFKYNRRR